MELYEEGGSGRQDSSFEGVNRRERTDLFNQVI